MSGGGSVVTVRVASEEVSVYDGGTAGTAHNVYSVSSETRSESLEVGVDMSGARPGQKVPRECVIFKKKLLK